MTHPTPGGVDRLAAQLTLDPGSVAQVGDPAALIRALAARVTTLAADRAALLEAGHRLITTNVVYCQIDPDDPGPRREQDLKRTLTSQAYELLAMHDVVDGVTESHPWTENAYPRAVQAHARATQSVLGLDQPGLDDEQAVVDLGRAQPPAAAVATRPAPTIAPAAPVRSRLARLLGKGAGR